MVGLLSIPTHRGEGNNSRGRKLVSDDYWMEGGFLCRVRRCSRFRLVAGAATGSFHASARQSG